MNQVSVLLSSSRLLVSHPVVKFFSFYLSRRRMRHQETRITSIYSISNGEVDYREDDSVLHLPEAKMTMQVKVCDYINRNYLGRDKVVELLHLVYKVV